MQVAIITGSGQGLGAAAAKLFAQHGARIVVTDLDGAKAEQVGFLIAVACSVHHGPGTSPGTLHGNAGSC